MLASHAGGPEFDPQTLHFKKPDMIAQAFKTRAGETETGGSYEFQANQRPCLKKGGWGEC